MQGLLVRLPQWGCWDTTDREGGGVSRKERLDRGDAGRSGRPRPYGALPAVTIQGEVLLAGGCSRTNNKEYSERVEQVVCVLLSLCQGRPITTHLS